MRKKSIFAALVDFYLINTMKQISLFLHSRCLCCLSEDIRAQAMSAKSVESVKSVDNKTSRAEDKKPCCLNQKNEKTENF